MNNNDSPTLVLSSLIVIAVVFMIGCLGWAMIDKSKPETTVKIHTPLVVTDPDTGCQYLYKNSLTPRLDTDGKHICKEKP